MGPISPAHAPALFGDPPLPSHPTPLKAQRRLRPWGGDSIQPYGRFKRGGCADWKQDDNGVIKPQSLKQRGSGDLESGSFMAGLAGRVGSRFGGSKFGFVLENMNFCFCVAWWISCRFVLINTPPVRKPNFHVAEPQSTLSALENWKKKKTDACIHFNYIF